MSNERTDEFLSWRGRLDQPGALPEQGLDNHEASWQHLAERLGEKHRRRMIGYWVAAACLLLAGVPAIRFFHPRPPAIALKPSALQRTPVQKAATRVLLLEQTTLPPPIVNHHLSSGPRPSHRLAPDSIIDPTAPTATTAAAITVPDITPVTDSHQLIALLPAAPSRILPKKQLKVVYYNEISNPSGPSPSTADRIPPFLKFSMGRSRNPVAGGDQDEPDNKTGLTILLIPQNH